MVLKIFFQPLRTWEQCLRGRIPVKFVEAAYGAEAGRKCHALVLRNPAIIKQHCREPLNLDPSFGVTLANVGLHDLAETCGFSMDQGTSFGIFSYCNLQFVRHQNFY